MRDTRPVEDAPGLQSARTSDGVTIAYQVFGSGPAVVWLPSLSNIVSHWRIPFLRNAYRHLARSMTVLIYDGRGTGSSDRRVDPNDLGIEAHLRDLQAVVVASGLDTVSLLGYYHSVATAIAYAAENPRSVTRLVLFGGAARMRETMTPVQTQALLSLVEQDWDLFADAAAQTWLGWGSGESAQLVAEAFRGAATPTMANAWFAAAQSIDVTASVPRVVAPTMVLHRQSERQIPVEVSRRLAAALPNGQLVELPGSSPTLFMENARADLDLVTTYLSTGLVRSVEVPSRAGDLVTAREMEVLRLIAAGDSNAEIARSLGIAVHTVERHAANLYRKIGARGRADATAYALRRGLG